MAGKNCRVPHRPPGFTLFELLVAIVLTAVLLSIAAPSFVSFIQNRRITAATNDLMTAVQQARAEAIKRSATVVLCRTGDPNDLADTSDEDPVCGASVYPSGESSQSKEWGPGWLMYARPVGSEAAAAYDKNTDALVLVGAAAPPGVDITSDDDAQTLLAFFGDGSLNLAGPAVFSVCDQRGAGAGKTITIPRGGRPQLSDATTCAP